LALPLIISPASTLRYLVCPFISPSTPSSCYKSRSSCLCVIIDCFVFVLQRWPSQRITQHTTSHTKLTKMASRNPRGIATPPRKGYFSFLSCESVTFVFFLRSTVLLIGLLCVDGPQVFEEPEVRKEA
jgi:hypothetical protein